MARIEKPNNFLKMRGFFGGNCSFICIFLQIMGSILSKINFRSSDQPLKGPSFDDILPYAETMRRIILGKSELSTDYIAERYRMPLPE